MGSCMSSSTVSSQSVKCSCRGRKQSKKERKREASETLAAEANQDELIASVAGRNCSNGSSRMASLFTQQGRKGINQDTMIVWEGFGMRKDTIFCGVFDGHGPYGHLVARRVRDSLPSKTLLKWQEALSIGSKVANGATETAAATTGPSNTNTEYPEMYEDWKNAYLAAYQLMDKELKFHPSIDCFCSGTTTVTVLKQGQNLVIANVGDSRAVLGTKDEDGNVIAVQLTVDLKPNLPQEEERIRQYRGRVFALQDEPQVHRVWLPHDDSPGLAMARAFGDFCLKEFGLISVPEISYRRLSEKDIFIVLATDGVWDVLSNAEAIEIIAAAPTRRMAARSLVESAVRAWRLKYPTSKVDDCAVVCLFLDVNLMSEDRSQDNEAKDDAKNVVDILSSTFPNPASNAAPASNGNNNMEVAKIGLVGLQTVPEVTIKDTDTILEKVEVPKVSALKCSSIESSSQARYSLKERLAATDDEEWSALDGVTRVNSLVNLPRFLGHDSESSSKSIQQ